MMMALASTVPFKPSTALPTRRSSLSQSVARASCMPSAGFCVRVSNPPPARAVRRAVTVRRPSGCSPGVGRLAGDVNDGHSSYENCNSTMASNKRGRQQTYYRGVFWPFGRINRLAHELYNEIGGELIRDLEGWQHEEAEWRLSVDIIDEAAAYVIKADVPGIHKDDIKLKVSEDTVLVLTAERRKADATASQDGDAVNRTAERRFGKFKRVISLPKNGDTDRVSADVKDGVLTIIVPKVEGYSKDREVVIS